MPLEPVEVQASVDHRGGGTVQLERGAVAVDRGLEDQTRDLLRTGRIVAHASGSEADPADVAREDLGLSRVNVVHAGSNSFPMHPRSERSR
jgi:hypothetical protein